MSKLDRIKWILITRPSDEYAPVAAAVAQILAILLVREAREASK